MHELNFPPTTRARCLLGKTFFIRQRAQLRYGEGNYDSESSEDSDGGWVTFRGIAQARPLQKNEVAPISQIQIEAGGQREYKKSDAESSAGDGYDSNYLDSSDDDEEDDTSNHEYQSSGLPTHFLGRAIDRRPTQQHVKALIDNNITDDPQTTLHSRAAATNDLRGDSSTNENPVPFTNGENITHQSSNGPPSPWGTSKSKQKIINELADKKSDIHLLIGCYTPSDFSNVNFKQILQKYAGNRYKGSNFRENMKRLLKHHLNETGPFKVEEVEPWYTSANNVSRAYSLLFMLYMDPTKYSIISGMTTDQIYASHPQFQLYGPDKFKTYNDNMKNLTSKRKKQMRAEEASFKRDMLKLPKINKTSRGYPFWHTHQASELMKNHITDEMLGKVEKTKPQQLWKSRAEYQAFPLSIFRKHIYQERSKQLAAPYWQHKRNKNAQKKYEEADEILKEWNQIQINGKIDGLVGDWGKLNLGNSN
ncbi:hypothetical protein ACHAXR_006714 [Thalassiosira sp. AJA248-18]